MDDPPTIDALITLDGALGGAPRFESWIAAFLGDWGDPAATNLVDIWRSASDHYNQGSTVPGNEEIVILARSKGTKVMTLGSQDDCIWNPFKCSLPATQDNSSSQYISSADVSIPFSLGGNCFLFCVKNSHSMILNNGTVLHLISSQFGSPNVTHIAPQESVTYNIGISSGWNQASFSITWAGSDVEMTLSSPSGRIINRDSISSDIFHYNGSSFEVFTISNPETGTWDVNLFGADLPPEGEDVSFTFTTSDIPVNNAPTVDGGNQYTASEGGFEELISLGNDPDGDPLTYAWDLDADGIFETPGLNVIFSAADLDGPSSHTVIVQVTDPGGLIGFDLVTVSVNNTNPSADFTGTPETLNEGESVSLSFLNPYDSGVVDTAAGFLYSYDCTNDGLFELTDVTSPAFECTYADNGLFTARGRIKDKDGGSTEYTAAITVENIPPIVSDISTSVDLAQVNTVINTTALMTDPSLQDTHTAAWDWGDGISTDGLVTENNGSWVVSGSHSYTTQGVYTIILTVTDDDGGVGSAIYRYVVVYDPNGGFVTGGGWINSPEGAYTPDPTLTGKATFGFVSKYQKGAHVPTGNTEFQFPVADLNFKSTSYDWLVIAGSKAQYKGTGTINGAGEYGFMLTAIDGSPDKFRIKIWDKATDEVIYDNQLGASDDADPTTAIQGGSIVIHKTN